MRIGGIGGPAVPRRATDRREPIPEKTRALIAIAAPAVADRAPSRTRHPAAPFLAQLIATQMQAAADPRPPPRRARGGDCGAMRRIRVAPPDAPRQA